MPRGTNFTPEEDLQLVRLHAARWTYAEITAVLPTRTAKSLKSRHQKLSRDGELKRLLTFLKMPPRPEPTQTPPG